MKYAAVIASLAIGAFALPQEASNSITSAPTPTEASLTPQVSCALACDPADVTCQASCMGIARPNESQAIDTTKCAEKCDQGSGSPEDTQKYSDCVQSCISSLFPSSQTNFPGNNNAPASGSAKATGSQSDEASATGSNPQATGAGAKESGAKESGAKESGKESGSGSDSGSPSSTESSAPTEETGAASSNQVAAGLFGIALAAFAL